MIDDALKKMLAETDEKMTKAMEHLHTELMGIRAGRATASMVDHIKVDYYGSKTPLNQIASVTAPQADMIVIQPWDANALEAIEKSILSADLGFNPSNDGALIRIPVPPLSEERRRGLVKTARSRGEDAKVAIRNIRRHTRDHIKASEKELHVSEDMRHEAEDKLQKKTDEFIGRVDKLLDHKEAEIMEV